MLSVNQKILAQTFKNNLSAKVTKLKSNLMHTKSTLTLLLLKITHLNQKFSSYLYEGDEKNYYRESKFLNDSCVFARSET